MLFERMKVMYVTILFFEKKLLTSGNILDFNMVSYDTRLTTSSPDRPEQQITNQLRIRQKSHAIRQSSVDDVRIAWLSRYVAF